MTLFHKFTGPQKADVVFHRQTVTVDKYGDRTATSEDVTVRALFAPATPAEYETGDFTGNVSPAAVYLDGTELVPDSNDTCTVAGALWTVEGDPEVWHGAGVVVRLKRYGSVNG